MIIGIDEAKAHCRIDGTAEDGVLSACMDAAEAHIADYLGTIPTPVPAPVRAAALLLVADLFEHRESQVERQLFANKTFIALLNPYRAMSV